MTVVNKKVAQKVEAIYRNYKEKGWDYQQYIACLEPLGEERGQSKYGVTPFEYGQFLIQLFDLWYGDFRKRKAPYIRQFYNYLQIMTGHCPEACDQTGHCGKQIVVEADGSVYPCDFYVLDQYYLGNFNENRISDIENRRKEIGFIERSRNISEDCKKCKFYFICRGGCQRNREILGESQKYKNYFCQSYQMFFEYSLDKIAELTSKDIF